jgi:hypothetical protein
MSSTIADFMVRINSDVHGLTAGTDKTRREMKRVQSEIDATGRHFSTWSKKMDASFGRAKSGMENLLKGNIRGGIKDLGGSFEALGGKGAGAVAGIAAVAAAVVGVYLIGKKAVGVYADLAGTLSQTQRMTGLSGAGALDLYAQFKMTGTDPTAAATAIGKFSKALDAARTGGAGLELFQRLGVDVKDANGKLRDGNTVLAETRRALSKLTDPFQRNAMAMAVFGRGWQSLGKWITASEEDIKSFNAIVKDSGFKFGKGEKKDFATFVKAQREMNLRWQLMWAMIGQKIIPLLNTMLKKYIAPALTRFERFVKIIESIPGFTGAVKDAFGIMFGPLFQAADAIDKIMKAIEQIQARSPKAREGVLSALDSLYSTIPGFSQLKGAAGWIQGGNPLPGFASGGIASGPSSGYLAMLHGTEIVTPVRGASSGRGGNINLTVNIANLNGTDERAARQLSEMVGRHLMRGTLRQMVGQNA